MLRQTLSAVILLLLLLKSSTYKESTRDAMMHRGSACSICTELLADPTAVWQEGGTTTIQVHGDAQCTVSETSHTAQQP